MDELHQKYRPLLQRTSLNFVRQHYIQIDRSARAISIEGARGVGKSTLLLQHIKKAKLAKQSLYISLDDLYFQENSLTQVAQHFVQQGGKHLFLDEVHKYPQWQRELKNIYDFYPDLQLIISGSSILALQESAVDLSRRLLRYRLPELSFREFLDLEKGLNLAPIALEDILEDPSAAVDLVKAQVEHPLALFEEYQKLGAYPFYREGKNSYASRLSQVVNLIIDYDLPEGRHMERATLIKLKQLLYIISRSVPFQPNIASLARRIQTSRIRLLEMLQTLETAQLIYLLRSSVQGLSHLNKPEKVYLHNTNLIHLLAEGLPNRGNLRETFFINALESAGHRVTSAKHGDFIVNNRYTFEIGGHNKQGKQIAGIANAFLALDNLEYGSSENIPLWLFGMLY